MTDAVKLLCGVQIHAVPRDTESRPAYTGEWSVGEEGEAFKQVLVVIILDHGRPVSLQHKNRGYGLMYTDYRLHRDSGRTWNY